MVTHETRLLTADEQAAVRSEIERQLPAPTSRKRWFDWLWWGALAMFPLAYGIISGSLVTLLVLLVVEILFVLFLVWWSGMADRRLANLRGQLLEQIVGGEHAVTTVEQAEYLAVEAYGMQLWLVQCSFSETMRLASTMPRAPGDFPSDRFQLIGLRWRIDTPSDGKSANSEAQEVADRPVLLWLVRPLGATVTPLGVIGPAEYERIRHLAPDEGQLGHGRIQSMLELLSRRTA